MKNNKGSAAIEAMVVIPLFLFAMMAFVYMENVIAVKSVIYEASIETTEYMAEYAYLSNKYKDKVAAADYIMAKMKFDEYLDDEKMLEKYVVNGKDGINFLGSSFPDEDGYIELKVNYSVKINIPFICSISQHETESIRQKAYLGYSEDDSENEEKKDRYVYVTENMEAYHLSRNCSYLSPETYVTSVDNAVYLGYSACEYCGDMCGSTVYVSKAGEKYHSTLACSRVKRKVYRKKLSEVEGINACIRCGQE